MIFWGKIKKTRLAVSWLLLAMVLTFFFQNCKISKYEKNLALEVDPNTFVPVVQSTDSGKVLYDNTCAFCHGAFSDSTLKDAIVNRETIAKALKDVSRMTPMASQLTPEQIQSIEDLFAGNSTPMDPVKESEFACNPADVAKPGSTNLRRLTGIELKNTYQAILPTAIFSALSNSLTLLPSDTVIDPLEKFNPTYTDSQHERIVRFNNAVAVAISSNAANIASFYGSCATATSFTQACFNTFANSNLLRIWRGQRTTAEINELWRIASSYTQIVDRLNVLSLLIFNDANFLFHIENGAAEPDSTGKIALTAFEVANRVAYGMTSSPPDNELWNSAVSGQLLLNENLNLQIDRIGQTAAFKQNVLSYLKFYVGKDRAAIPPLNTTFLNGLDINGIDEAARLEFEDYANHVIFNSRGSLQNLFTANVAFPRTSAMARILNSNISVNGAPQISTTHTGLLSRPFLNMAGSLNNRLVQRGRSLRLNMLCFEIPEPSATDLAGRPVLTTEDFLRLSRRDYIDKATMAGATCISCHSKMNQLGFTTVQYDSAGRFIQTESIFNPSGAKVAEHPIDSKTIPRITSADDRGFADLNDFSAGFAQSNSMQKCFSRRVFQYFTKKIEKSDVDSCKLNRIDNAIKSNLPLVDVFLTYFKQQDVRFKRSVD